MGDPSTQSLVGTTAPSGGELGIKVRALVEGEVTVGASGLATSAAQTDGSQRVGVLGADGLALASNANPLPVGDGGGSITVDGTVAVTNANLDVALSTRAADSTLAAMSAKLPASLGTKAAAGSMSAALSTEDAANLSSAKTALDSLVAAISLGDPTFEVARTGQWRTKTGYTVNVMGRRTSFTASVLNDLVMFTPSAGSSTVINEMAGTEALEIVSSNTADAAAGTGVRTVEITYIDALGTVGAQNTTTVTMNGTTPVSLGSVRALAIQWAEAATVGGGNTAAGDITIRASATPTNVYELISAGGNRSLSGRYMVPVGMSAYAASWVGSAVNQDMDIRLRATVKMSSRAITTPYLFQDAMYPPAGATSPSRVLQWLKFPEGSKIKMSARPAAVGASPRCEASATFAVIQN